MRDRVTVPLGAGQEVVSASGSLCLSGSGSCATPGTASGSATISDSGDDTRACAAASGASLSGDDTRACAAASGGSLSHAGCGSLPVSRSLTQSTASFTGHASGCRHAPSVTAGGPTANATRTTASATGSASPPASRSRAGPPGGPWRQRARRVGAAIMHGLLWGLCFGAAAQVVHSLCPGMGAICTTGIAAAVAAGGVAAVSEGVDAARDSNVERTNSEWVDARRAARDSDAART